VLVGGAVVVLYDDAGEPSPEVPAV